MPLTEVRGGGHSVERLKNDVRCVSELEELRPNHSILSPCIVLTVIFPVHVSKITVLP